MTGQAGSVLVDLLTDPAGFWTSIGGTGLGWLTAQAPVLAPSALLASAGGFVLTRSLRIRQQQYLAKDARCVEILAPPTVAPRGGEVLWAQLTGLLRPWWRRATRPSPSSTSGPTQDCVSACGCRAPCPSGSCAAPWRRPGPAPTPASPRPPSSPPGATRSPADGCASRARTFCPCGPTTRPTPARDAPGSGRHGRRRIGVRSDPGPSATGGALRRARRQARRLKAGQTPPGSPHWPPFSSTAPNLPRPASRTPSTPPPYGRPPRNSPAPNGSAPSPTRPRAPPIPSAPTTSCGAEHTLSPPPLACTPTATTWPVRVFDRRSSR